MPTPSIELKEYAARRKKLLTALKDAIGVVFAGGVASPLHDDFRPHPHFEYLTGVVDEPDAILVLDPTSPVENRREMLFLRPLNPEIEKWDGYRLEVSKALRDRVGMKAVFRTTHLPRFLSEAARRARKLACMHTPAWYDQPITPDLELFRKIAERTPGTEIVDKSDAPVRLRSVKSAGEVRMIQHAVDMTRESLAEAFALVKPGMNERDVQVAIEHGYRTRGSRGPAFGTIVGAGVNSTVLHYRANDQPIDKGDLICIDTGAEYRGYGADITRTIPASGKFTKRQREIYDIVLKAEQAAIRAIKPGVTNAQIDQVARAIINKAGFGDYFIHGIGHHLGLETHDANPDLPYRAGNVVTVEPGIYLPDEAIGVRIEDDVVVTKDGHRVLSAKIPRRADAIEKMMAE